jgi:hypothetical protein
MATINNLYIDQGTTFSVQIQVFDANGDPLNITGYTANSQIRKSYASTSATQAFAADVTNPANGIITLSMTAQQTANIKYGRYVYDVEIINNDVIYRASEGIVTVYPEVTR